MLSSSREVLPNSGMQMIDIDLWLTELGLGHHVAVFRANGIAGDVVRDLTEADLRALGLNLGDRKRLLKALIALGSAHTPPASHGRAERRQLTVMFVDLVGSTELATRLDPEDMGAVLARYRQTVASEVDRFEGHVAKFMGDGCWPISGGRGRMRTNPSAR